MPEYANRNGQKDIEKELSTFYQTCTAYTESLVNTELQLFSAYMEYLKPKSGSLILDVGCGAGQAVDYLSKEGYQVLGIDISPHWNKTKSSHNFVIGSSYNLPFETNVFDSVGCHELLEHLYHPDQCLAEMVRVLKPGGKIVIITHHYRIDKCSETPEKSRLNFEIYKGPKNILYTFTNYIKSLFQLGDVHFDFCSPVLDYTGERISGDYDAVCIANPVIIKHYLRRFGARIIHQQVTNGTSKNYFIRAASNMIRHIPFIRDLFGIVFLVGIKRGRNGWKLNHSPLRN